MAIPTKYAERPRTRQLFNLIGVEHRGRRAGNVRLVCHVRDTEGLLAIWGTEGHDMRHIEEMEAAIQQRGFPLTVVCDWITPDEYEAAHFRHQYWAWETDYFAIQPRTA